MEWMRNKPITLLCLAGGAVSVLLAWQMGQPILSAIAALCFLAAIAIWRMGWWLGPFVMGATKTKIGGDDGELLPSGDVLVSRTSSGWRASMFLGVQLRESATSSSTSQQSLMMELFEKALGGLRYPVQLSVMVCPLDTSDHIQKLEERRSLAEHRKANLSGARSSDEAAKLEREIDAYTVQIRRLSGGEKPMKVAAWAATTALGLTREEAVSRVRAQAQESISVLSGSLACTVSVLAGDELLRAADWQKWMPVSRAELEDQTF